ncbi:MULTISPECIES: OmpH family outer membrane protein [Shewanella]|jgi:outer membrane protein|nr:MULTISPECIES: OmpH family outer membrane protein [Shewanella]MCL1151527.1 OmpH family outer membrane protein [Shewanella ulleungensis]MCL1158646.1 OmpH family outer membrane protein [Shewanella inventionis]UAL45340.1 OmpH family outer membrane protein [Shewanella inventionis]
MVNRALVTLALIATPMLAHAEKIAVVDMGEVFEQLPQREQISKSLKAEFGDRVAEVQKMQEEMRSLVEKQQRDGALMSDTQKTELVRKMDSLKSEFQLKGKALDEDMRRRQGEEQNKLLVQVQKAINTIAGKENYDLVLQRGAVIFVKPEADISGKVVEALSKGK